MASEITKLPLFVGRFQPLHKGHLEVIRQLSKEGRFVIVIGSMQKSYTAKNPFTFSERKEVIKRVLRKDRIRNCKIYGLPDFDNDKAWSKELIRLVGTKNIKAYTRNAWTKKCLEKEGIEVIRNPLYFGISATKIRSRIREGLEWKSLVPPEVFAYLKEIDGAWRVRNPAKRN